MPTSPIHAMAAAALASAAVVVAAFCVAVPVTAFLLAAIATLAITVVAIFAFSVPGPTTNRVILSESAAEVEGPAVAPRPTQNPGHPERTKALLYFAVGLARPRSTLALLLCGLTSIYSQSQDPDTACRTCHRQIYDRYQQTSMAKASGAARDGLDDALLNAAPLTHRPSGITYRVTLQQGRPTLTFDRTGTLHGEHPLSYFIGSGKRGRTFLYQQEGFWFEAPINWYGKQKLWDMAPAYGEATTMPDPLPVDPNCLHCHTGEAQPAAGPARNFYSGPPFLSAGIGCAACHGDPTAHLASARNPILNPDKLTPTRRDSVCLQCHLEADATVYLPGKSLAAFQPGEDLSATALYFVDRTRAQLGGRATSQYEALLRSACRRAAGDRLTCTTCHDPHSSPAPAERVAFFRAKCLTCHTNPRIATSHHPDQQDCATCHMPTRKTLDISHEQLTDHDIEARPNLTPATFPDRLHTPDLVPVGNTGSTDRELGLAYAQFAVRGDRKAGARALTLLQQAEATGAGNSQVPDTELHTQLAFLHQVSNSPEKAAAEYRAALAAAAPYNSNALTAAANLAVLAAASGHPEEAARLLTQVVHDDPAQIPAALNLAFLQCNTGRPAEARATLDRALLFNPDNPQARRFLATGDYAGRHCSLPPPVLEDRSSR